VISAAPKAAMINIHLEANTKRHVLSTEVKAFCQAVSNDSAWSSKAFKAGLCEATEQFHLDLRIISQMLVVCLAAKTWVRRAEYELPSGKYLATVLTDLIRRRFHFGCLSWVNIT
jgi:hypothetical protein